MKTFVITLLMLLALAAPAYPQCVQQDQVKELLERLIVNPEEARGANAVCTPCTCGSTADCYEYLGRREREKYAQFKSDYEVLEQIKKYGICRADW